MKKINLKNIFSKTVNFNPKKEEVWPTQFARDWKIIVLVFALGLLIVSFFAWQIYLSDKIGGGFLSEEVPLVSNIDTLDTKRLKADLLILETHQSDYQSIKANQPKIVDPSL